MTNLKATPFDVLCCSWPFPLTHDEFRPDWQAQLTHLRPVPEWRLSGNQLYWNIDWAELFRGGARFRGTMRQFGVVFRIRVSAAGQLACCSRGRSTVKRGDRVLFTGVSDREVFIDTRAGDILDIAVAHDFDDWSWGARSAEAAKAGPELMNTHLPRVEARLREPDGPPLKIFTDARHPMRTVISVYSMILNGYSPSRVYLYGDYQWKPFARTLLSQFLPFASVVPLSSVRDQVSKLAQAPLIDAAVNHWFVMKACVSLLCEPTGFSMMDDDIFILKPVADAQALFREQHFVFVPENDNATLYRSIWSGLFGDIPLTATSRLNTALYWLRMLKDRAAVAALMSSGLDRLSDAWAWEQGFYAHLFDGDRVLELPEAAYWYSFRGGLPGGMMGYDYANNPCGFTMVHFGGDVEKPNDNDALQLMPQILGRESAR